MKNHRKQSQTCSCCSDREKLEKALEKFGRQLLLARVLAFLVAVLSHC